MEEGEEGRKTGNRTGSCTRIPVWRAQCPKLLDDAVVCLDVRWQGRRDSHPHCLIESQVAYMLADALVCIVKLVLPERFALSTCRVRTGCSA